MAMGRRKVSRQEPLFVTAEQLPRSQGHPFYKALNALLAEAGFDRWIEKRCQPFYEQVETRGQRSTPPGVYFRMLLVGYFEGIDSQRGIAWRCSDSLSLREFLGIPLHEGSPEHSTLSLTRRRLPVEVFEEVFQFVLKIASEKKLLSGKTVGVDSTTLEADAAMKSIVRRDTGEGWKAYVVRLMREEGVIAPGEEPSDEDVRRFDRNRKDKKVSNEEWVSETDPEAKIARMKDGTTHLAYKAEHVVDLESDLILAAEIRPADHGDQQTLVDSVLKAEENLQAIGCVQSIEEVAADSVRSSQQRWNSNVRTCALGRSRPGTNFRHAWKCYDHTFSGDSSAVTRGAVVIAWHLRTKRTGVKKVSSVKPVKPVKGIKPVKTVRSVKPIAPVGQEYYCRD